MSAELEKRLEQARRHELCSTSTFYRRLTDSVYFFKEFFRCIFLKDCIMHGGLVK